MAKKYLELVEKYSKEIASLKAAKAKVDELDKKIKSFKYDDDDFAVWTQSEELAHEWTLVNDEYQIQASELIQDIEAEYNDVPFAKARKQGIEKFWELAGI